MTQKFLIKTEPLIYADRDLLVHNIDEMEVPGTGALQWTLDGSNYIVPSASHPVAPITHQTESLGVDTTREWLKLNTKNIFVSGRIGIGETSPSSQFEIHADGACVLEIFRYSNDTGSPNILQNKARGTKALPAVPNVSDQAGANSFKAWDGAAFQQVAGMIGAIDGTVTAGDTPGRLVFKTTPVGSTTLAEIVRINSKGNIGFGKTTFGTGLVKGLCWGSGTAPSTSPTDAVQLWVADRGAVAGKAGLHMRAEGGCLNVFGDLSGFGTINPTAKLEVQAGLIEIAIMGVGDCYGVQGFGETSGVYGEGGNGVQGQGTDTGVYGQGTVTGVYGEGGTTGVWGQSIDIGVEGVGTNYGVKGTGAWGGWFSGDGYFSGRLGIGTEVFGADIGECLALGGEGLSPTTFPADIFQVIAKDIVAGECAPHFFTEHGDCIKLYQQAAIANKVAGQMDTEAKIITAYNALLTVLRNTGFIAT